MTYLEQLIRDCLETQNPVLDLSYQGFCDGVYPELKLLEECTHLTSLNLTENYGIDLSFLPFLTNLTYLNLDEVYPPDFSILQSLTNLTYLSVTMSEYGFENDVPYDISSLQYLINLISLNLDTVTISDISPLQYLTNLTSLNLNYTQISDISPLQYLTNLTNLSFDSRNISDISALQYCTNLKDLNLQLYETQITDISALQYLTNLTSLSLQLSETQITDISVLQYLTSLTSLNLELTSAQISDISALQYLTNLTSLNLQGGLFSDISALKYLTNLTSLNLSGRISDISPLQYLTNLKSLNLRGLISDISSLQYLINLTTLNLQNNQIFDVFPLQYLTNLTTLNLQNNQISDISALKYLTNLTSLDLSSNYTRFYEIRKVIKNNKRNNIIKEFYSLFQSLISKILPNTTKKHSIFRSLISKIFPYSTDKIGCLLLSDISALKYLTNLTTLNLNTNNISDISALQYLINLTTLNLGNNKISDISPLHYLTNLKELFLSRNQVSDIYLLQSLINLTNLKLESNQITDISLSWLNSLTSLYSIGLSGNPIKNIPQEIFTDFGNIHKMRDFLGDLEKFEGIENKEIKVIFIGNGNVGKTQIAKRLVEKEKFVFDSQHNSTHAIVMLRRKLGNFQLNCWDFAGQDLYHATHQLFMQTNALFVLVWDFENENRDFHEWHNTKYENEKLHYWLEYARYFAKKSPILVLKNKMDMFSEDFSVEQKEELKKQYFILDFLNVSAKTSQGFEELENKLKTIFAENPSFQSPNLPTNWVEVREEMLKLQGNYTKTIEFSEFEAICQSKGTQKSASTILGYLHDTGVVYHKNIYFNNKIIINQSWVIEAIYKVLDRESPEFKVLKAQKGLFLYENIAKIWKNHSEEDQRIFIDFMLSAGLAFEKKANHSNNFSDRTFIVPQFLPSDKPDEVSAWEWQRENAFTLQNVRKTHSFLPKGLIYGVMTYVSYLSELEEINYMWQKGIFFKMKTGEVLIEFYEENQSKIISIKSKTDALIQKIMEGLQYY